MAANITQVINEDASQRTLAPVAVGSQVALMSIISFATIIFFNVLRPRNKIVYEPKVKYHVGDKRPPRMSDSMLGWLPPVLHTKEPELVNKIGLDAAIYLRFLRMLRWLFTALTFICCAVLMPLDIVYNLQNIPTKSRDVLSILTIRDLSGWRLWIHVAIMYIVTGIVTAFVWYHWREVVRLRREWFRSPEYIQSFYARTLMITKVPKKLQSDEGIRAVFQSVQVPYPTTSVSIGRRVGQLPELIEFHNNTVRELEAVLVTYLKDGKLNKERPQKRLGGFMCFGGQKVDAINYYMAKLKRTEDAVERYREQIDLRQPETYGFASMAAVPYAHIVANLLRDKHPKGTTVALAPNPKDIVWTNLNKSSAEVARNRTIGWAFLVLVCFVNTVPLSIISILANLASLTAYVPFLEAWAVNSKATFTVISGVLPPAVSALFGYVLPIIMRRLTKYMGAYTHSQLDRAVVARYYAFLVISQLIIFTLIGVMFNSVTQIVDEIGRHKSFKEIIENLNSLPGLITNTYIDQASYWLTYFPLRGFLCVFDLAQIINLVVVFIKKSILFGRTPREIREWTQPPEFQYSIYYSNLLFMATVGLFFAPIAPLVTVAAMVVFWISSWVYKYQLMFVFISQVETGGRLWNVVVNRLLASVILMHLIMMLTIGFKFGFGTFRWIAAIPPMLITIGFKIYLTRTFLPAFQYYIPTEEELRQAAVHSKRSDNLNNKLEKRFGHPALHQDLFTPMVHANMTHLLPEVFDGKIGSTKTALDDMGGNKVDAAVVGGVRIAGIEEHDLEYDPSLYRRDRGELDWDQRSMASTTMLNDNNSMAQLNLAGRGSPAPSKMGGHDRYLASGPQPEIEMARLDYDQQPLLHAAQTPGYYQAEAANRSMASFSQHGSPYGTPQMEHPPPMPPMAVSYDNRVDQGYRQAPVYRPNPSHSDSWRP
ncbi:uncharacterized protein B0H18DRAFT_880648 [Fomitopsis serialis]|uniref:uncharacterized protein n=1 Tax=Fomitopsis serialis TaxID=139415 RepID=UPI002008D164|nr:uncharacterized protein B0H18DRAFT_880648 [Neoantrodia serialis]KAH9920930.1 hypothetical protein B0H18DRAFT_880648 [Neoantrodia serialis]